MSKILSSSLAAVLVLGLGAGVLLAAQATPAQEGPPYDSAAALAKIKASIAGREEKPAEEVFKNVKMFKGAPASRLLRAMEAGFTRSLGVNCTHCHVPDEWDKEDKPTKQITRDMAAMTQTINTEIKKIPNLHSPNPTVGCALCHRGEARPRPQLPGQPAAAPAAAQPRP
jgi:hypothetical protein